MPSQVIKQAPRADAVVTIATAIDSASAGDDVALTVVQKAYLEAKALREAAAREAVRLRAEAREEGLAQARAEFEETLARFGRLVAGLAAAVQRAAEDATPIIADLAVEVAARILCTEVTVRPEVVAAMVSDAVARLAGAAEVTVRVHPDDLAAVEAHRPRIEEAAGGRLQIVGDDRTDGGCLVESASGLVDARLSTQLREMRKALHEAMRD